MKLDAFRTSEVHELRAFLALKNWLATAATRRSKQSEAVHPQRFAPWAPSNGTIEDFLRIPARGQRAVVHRLKVEVPPPQELIIGVPLEVSLEDLPDFENAVVTAAADRRHADELRLTHRQKEGWRHHTV